MQNQNEGILSAIRSSQMLRILLVGFLALILQIPIAMIGSVVSERQARRDAAVKEVSSKWGNPQQITGPVLVIPYLHRWNEEGKNGQALTRTETRRATFLPETVHFLGKIDSENRARGIFSVPVYRLALTMEGTFVQYAGRLHREHQGKAEVRLFDYLDVEVPVLARMFERRLKGYRAMGYEREASFEPDRARDGRVIEYDEEALRSLNVDPS